MIINPKKVAYNLRITMVSYQLLSGHSTSKLCSVSVACPSETTDSASPGAAATVAENLPDLLAANIPGRPSQPTVSHGQAADAVVALVKSLGQVIMEHSYAS